ncbi:glutamine synthetase III [Desulfovibrio litoralis]|uniref:Glutamine synthetase n=1 Tax=Desulfovibrio litoralis DSM 11393 TaxID=1121455 RepID=A0A1M7TIZ6_9BACT|nr:glutamine synthetase III [Desulfovibrio litoralis]SHN70681.1 glutamine synthetase [Desulfovibrio litoralis DSM 11393]
MSDRSKGRRKAISQIAGTQPLSLDFDYLKKSVSEQFGSLVFDEKEMQKRLPQDIFLRLQKTMKEGSPLDLSLADIVANAMKEWAVSHGVTHYTHWFQPMTGSSAEKHDSFFDLNKQGKAVIEFSGRNLIKGESDASSFPSGGIRSTFEARGYTAWDARSPVFLKESCGSMTMCIPTAFYSYTGECLDRKTPLLRSLDVISKQSLRILRLFGNNTSTHVKSCLGAEQEYFLVDQQFYLQRPDLVNTGRTLFGAKPPKGQEMADHYYGPIRARILSFMRDIEHQLIRLGVPVKTRHNEAAPAQFELAPIFEEANIATDHNMLIMETLYGTARKHGFVCLLHEKPFRGVNGSGKHCNWSLSDSEGNNLLEPGKTPHENAQFLVFLCAAVRAVYKYSGLLRVGTATAGNDHRLGAHEAPPAILSVYLGSQLNQIVECIISKNEQSNTKGETIQVGVSSLPPLPRDATDRNRTSPFAFTGNKFEFRMVGSSQSTSPAVFLINTVVSESLDEIATILEAEVAKGVKLNEAVQTLLQQMFSEAKPIIFNGDNYSAAWLTEAAKRGLPNYKDTVSALEQFTSEKNIEVLSKYGVLSKREVESRSDVLLANYSTTIRIEAQLVSNIGRTLILPAALEYQKQLADNILSLQNCLGKDCCIAQKQILEKAIAHTNKLLENLDSLDKAILMIEDEVKISRNNPAKNVSALELAKLVRDNLIPLSEACRQEADALELLVDDFLWALPKYRELVWIL